MPIWAMIIALIWMFFIPHFTAASLKAIFVINPFAAEIPAKITALCVGVTWPICFAIGLFRMSKKH